MGDVFFITAANIIYFKFIQPDLHTEENLFRGISPEGIGTLGAAINVVVTLTVSYLTPAPPAHIQELVEEIRVPRGAGEAHEVSG